MGFAQDGVVRFLGERRERSLKIEGRRKAYLIELQQLIALVAEVPCAHREEALDRIFRGRNAADDCDQAANASIESGSTHPESVST